MFKFGVGIETGDLSSVIYHLLFMVCDFYSLQFFPSPFLLVRERFSWAKKDKIYELLS
jgi:hypothetical protein